MNQASSILEDNSLPAAAGDEESGSESLLWKNQKKHFFVLSEAGKPIYTRLSSILAHFLTVDD